MPEERMSEGLSRQRRNLLAISIVLVFAKFSGVQIEELVFLGINFGTLENPQAVYLGMWAMFFYFFVRYYQYYMQEGRSNLLGAITAFVEPKLQQIGRDICKRTANDATYDPGSLHALRHADWAFKITYNKGMSDSGFDMSEVDEVKISRSQLVSAFLTSALYVIFNRSEASDFLFPFIVAAVAFLYCLSGAESSLIESMRALNEA